MSWVELCWELNDSTTFSVLERMITRLVVLPGQVVNPHCPKARSGTEKQTITNSSIFFYNIKKMVVLCIVATAVAKTISLAFFVFLRVAATNNNTGQHVSLFFHLVYTDMLADRNGA